jgi:hypothetical protein
MRLAATAFLRSNWLNQVGRDLRSCWASDKAGALAVFAEIGILLIVGEFIA